jgi:hypothetical protein
MTLVVTKMWIPWGKPLPASVEVLHACKVFVTLVRGERPR